MYSELVVGGAAALSATPVQRSLGGVLDVRTSARAFNRTLLPFAALRAETIDPLLA
jgi:hypothetical protein